MMKIIKRNGGLLIIYLIFLVTALILVHDVHSEELNTKEKNSEIALKK